MFLTLFSIIPKPLIFKIIFVWSRYQQSALKSLFENYFLSTERKGTQNLFFDYFVLLISLFGLQTSRVNHITYFIHQKLWRKWILCIFQWHHLTLLSILLPLISSNFKTCIFYDRMTKVNLTYSVKAVSNVCVFDKMDGVYCKLWFYFLLYSDI